MKIIPVKFKFTQFSSIFLHFYQIKKSLEPHFGKISGCALRQFFGIPNPGPHLQSS